MEDSNKDSVQIPGQPVNETLTKTDLQNLLVEFKTSVIDPLEKKLGDSVVKGINDRFTEIQRDVEGRTKAQNKDIQKLRKKLGITDDEDDDEPKKSSKSIDPAELEKELRQRIKQEQTTKLSVRKLKAIENISKIVGGLKNWEPEFDLAITEMALNSDEDTDFETRLGEYGKQIKEKQAAKKAEEEETKKLEAAQGMIPDGSGKPMPKIPPTTGVSPQDQKTLMDELQKAIDSKDQVKYNEILAKLNR